jgi:endonuclease YncB( thermonuclease family)
MILQLQVLALCFALADASAETFAGVVIAVADGDTITILQIDGEKRIPRKVRILGIDAPETKQPFGTRAKQTMSTLAFGKHGFADCSTVDRYGRDVCKVTVDQRDVGLELISKGFAWHFKRYQRSQLLADRASYAEAEDNARNVKVGLWSVVDPIPPWEWRKDKLSTR